MMKKPLRVIVYILILGLLIGAAAHILARPTNKEYFRSCDEEIDVLFFGNSHVSYGVYPLDLWKDYGLATYNLGNNGCGLPVSYHTLIEALKIQTPKLVVVDCSTVSSGFVDRNEDAAYNEFVQAALDWIPMSITKWEAAFDLTGNTTNSLYYFCNFGTYHSRWEEYRFKTKIGSPEYTYRGADRLNYVDIPSEIASVTDSEKVLPTADGYGDWSYLRKICELCNEKNVPILLTYIPFPADEVSLAESYTVHSIAEQYGADYLDFDTIYTGSGVNFLTDCSDAHSHLNQSGARKVTEFLGSYLAETYHFTDHRGEEPYSGWDDDYAIWVSDNYDMITRQNNPIFALSMLYRADIDVTVYLPEDSSLAEDSVFVSLLNQLMESGASLTSSPLNEGNGETDCAQLVTFSENTNTPVTLQLCITSRIDNRRTIITY